MASNDRNPRQSGYRACLHTCFAMLPPKSFVTNYWLLSYLQSSWKYLFLLNPTLEWRYLVKSNPHQCVTQSCQDSSACGYKEGISTSMTPNSYLCLSRTSGPSKKVPMSISIRSKGASLVLTCCSQLHSPFGATIVCFTLVISGG